MLPIGGDPKKNIEIMREQFRQMLLASGSTEKEADTLSSMDKILKACSDGSIQNLNADEVDEPSDIEDPSDLEDPSEVEEPSDIEDPSELEEEKKKKK